MADHWHINCLRMCIDKLPREKLDQITDNIHNTLTDSEGNKLLVQYLECKNYKDHLKCINLYNTSSQYQVEEERSHENLTEEERALESLINKVEEVQKDAAALDVREMDRSLMKKFREALQTKTKGALLHVLVDTKVQCEECLGKIHGKFTKSILESISA